MSISIWGSDIYGRLGQGTENIHISRPTEVKALSGVVLIAATCGSAHNIVVDSNNRCYTWGKCHYGQLGHGEMDQNELVPRPVAALNDVKIKAVAAGDSHVLAITTTGQLYTWGVGFYGCLGHNDEKPLALPKLVEALKDQQLASAAGGAFHSLAVTTSGSLFVWGRNHCGQIGFPASQVPNYAAGGKSTKLVRFDQKSPKNLTFPALCKKVAACNDHTLILLEGNALLSFGANDHGQLGREAGPSDEVTNPSANPDHFRIDTAHFQAASIKSIAAGWSHCAAVTEDGQLYCWGDGRLGQLGIGHTSGSRVPTEVKGFPEGSKVAQASCGESFTVVLDDCGRLWSFGGAEYGKLGLGERAAVAVPNQVLPAPPKVNKVQCGTNHVLALSLEQNT